MEINDFDKLMGNKESLVEYYRSLKSKEFHNAIHKQLFTRISEVLFVCNCIFQDNSLLEAFGKYVPVSEVSNAACRLLAWPDADGSLTLDEIIRIGRINLIARQSLLRLKEERGLFLP